MALPVVCESDFSKVVSCSVTAEISGEHIGTHGLLEVLESASSSKAGSATVVAPVAAESSDQAGVLHGSSLVLNSRIHPHGHRSRIDGSSHFPHARARAVAAVALPAGAASRSATPVIVTPARFSRSFAAVVADAAKACATSVHDSALNSGGAGGLLPVCKSTSYNLEVCSQGQRWGFRSSRRFASCLRGGGRGKFSAGWRGCRFTSQVATRSWYQAGVKGNVVTPSLHQEVPGTNSCNLDTDQWTGRRCVEPHGRGFGC